MRSGFKLGTFFSLVITAAMASCGSDETAPAAATCGNGIVEEGELCDGADLKQNTCQSAVAPGSSGVLRCNVTCNGFDTTGCAGGGMGGQGGTGPNP